MRMILFAPWISLVTLGTVHGDSPERLMKRMRLSDEDDDSTSTTTTTTMPPIVSTFASASDYYSSLRSNIPISVSNGVRVVGITERGRVIEEYDLDRVEGTFGNVTAQFVQKQIELDQLHDLFAPFASLNRSTIYTPFGELTIGGRIWSYGSLGITFSLPEIPGMVVKFGSNCDEIRLGKISGDAVVHPLMIDRMYGGRAGASELSAQRFFLSPPGPLCETKTGICEFLDMSDSQFNRCRNEGGTLRYMLLSDQPSLTSFRFLANLQTNRVLPFAAAMAIGSSLMGLLENLHTKLRIVHGDIGENSVHYTRLPGGNMVLKFVEFDKATHLVSNIAEGPGHAIPQHMTFYTDTQWMIDGYKLAPRDDVMRALNMVLGLLHPYTYFKIEKYHWKAGYESFKNFQMNSDLFNPILPWDTTKRLDPLSTLAVSENNKAGIRDIFANILTMVRGLNSTNSVIPYRELRDSFVACRHLATNRTMAV